MRTARIKIEPTASTAVYHCVCGTINGDPCLDDPARETLAKLLRQVADYCGVKILTYAITPDNFSVLVRVPVKTVPDDAELLRRFQALHARPTLTLQEQIRLRHIHEELQKGGGPCVAAWRKQQLALIGDVSLFMKMLKQRFTQWFNRTHARYGPIWSQRFKSVLVEDRANTLATVAAYIDLNPVRAKLVADPKDYPRCGYAEAVAGDKTAQAGIIDIVTDQTPPAWRVAHDLYRERLFGPATRKQKQKQTQTHANTPALTPETLKKLIAENRTLPLPSVLRSRVRYFSDGGVIGSEAFVTKHLAAGKRKNGRRKKPTVHPLPKITDWGDLVITHGLRKNAFE